MVVAGDHGGGLCDDDCFITGSVAAEHVRSRPRHQITNRIATPKEKAARRRLSNSILMIADQTTIKCRLGLATGRYQQQNIYFNEVLIEVNAVFRLVPMLLTAVMITIEMPAAIRPYSMAVAPDSSFQNLRKERFMECSNGGSPPRAAKVPDLPKPSPELFKVA